MNKIFFIQFLIKFLIDFIQVIFFTFLISIKLKNYKFLLLQIAYKILYNSMNYT